MKGEIILKKDRNCGMNPVMYSGAIPMGGMPGPLPMPMPMNTPYINEINYGNQDLSSIQNQIATLERRVTNLENVVNGSYSNNYNSSNYQMM